MAFHKRPQPRTQRPRGPWKHGPIPVIGLIGGIGAGKSQAASLLAEHQAFVIDADAVGHALLSQSPARDLVVHRFGKEILAQPEDADAETPPVIDRRALGAIVFASPAKLCDLESILHPRMLRTFERAIDRTIRRGQATAVVLDAAVLLEAGWETLCDLVLYVDAPREQRLERLQRQRGWTDEVLRSREDAQWSADKKRQAADAVIDNDADLEALRAAVKGFWNARVAAGGPRSGVGRRAQPRGTASAPFAQPLRESSDQPRRR